MQNGVFIEAANQPTAFLRLNTLHGFSPEIGLRLAKARREKAIIYCACSYHCPEKIRMRIFGPIDDAYGQSLRLDRYAIGDKHADGCFTTARPIRVRREDSERQFSPIIFSPFQLRSANVGSISAAAALVAESHDFEEYVRAAMIGVPANAWARYEQQRNNDFAPSVADTASSMLDCLNSIVFKGNLITEQVLANLELQIFIGIYHSDAQTVLSMAKVCDANIPLHFTKLIGSSGHPTRAILHAPAQIAERAFDSLWNLSGGTTAPPYLAVAIHNSTGVVHRLWLRPAFYDGAYLVIVDSDLERDPIFDIVRQRRPFIKAFTREEIPLLAASSFRWRWLGATWLFRPDLVLNQPQSFLEIAGVKIREGTSLDSKREEYENALDRRSKWLTSMFPDVPIEVSLC